VEDDSRTYPPDCLTHSLAFVAAEIVEHDNVVGRQGLDQFPFHIVRKALALIGPLRTHGASTRSHLSAATNVIVRQWPWGTWAISRVPRWPHPLSGAMLVFTQVSSMNTRRLGSILP
jgi:hypothetical protein